MAKTIKAYNEPADDEDAPEVPLPHARLHDLRHVHATLLLVAGVPVHVVADRLGHADPSEQVRAGLYEFHDWCATSGQPELHRLATTIERWWPAIRAFIATGITNAVSEGLNRVIKLEARKAYGFGNPANQRLRIRCATNRRTREHLKPA